MAVSRPRGKTRGGYIVSVYDRATMRKRYVGSFVSHARACEVEALAKRGLYERPQQVPLPDGSAVYCVLAPEVQRVKIGYGSDVRERVRELHTSCPVDFELLFAIPGDRALEEELHRRFRPYRVRGEWFELGPEIRAWIDERAPACSRNLLGGDVTREMSPLKDRHA